MATALTRSTPTAGAGTARWPGLIDQLIDERFPPSSVFDRTFHHLPGSSLYESTDEYIVQVVLPGMSIEGCDVQLTGQTLVIKGTRSLPAPQNATVIWQGIDSGAFAESMTLPGDVDTSQAEARYEQGILTITVPNTTATVMR